MADDFLADIDSKQAAGGFTSAVLARFRIHDPCFASSEDIVLRPFQVRRAD
jgi:hypothetical protein